MIPQYPVHTRHFLFPLRFVFLKTTDTDLRSTARLGQYFPRIAVYFDLNFTFAPISASEFYLVSTPPLISESPFSKIPNPHRKCVLDGRFLIFFKIFTTLTSFCVPCKTLRIPLCVQNHSCFLSGDLLFFIFGKVSFSPKLSTILPTGKVGAAAEAS